MAAAGAFITMGMPACRSPMYAIPTYGGANTMPRPGLTAVTWIPESDVRTVGPCRMVAANPTEATDKAGLGIGNDGLRSFEPLWRIHDDRVELSFVIPVSG